MRLIKSQILNSNLNLKNQIKIKIKIKQNIYIIKIGNIEWGVEKKYITIIGQYILCRQLSLQLLL